MPKLSLWRPGKSNDFKYLDNIIREQYTVGGLDVYIHKYLGPKLGAEPSGDATLPTYDETNPLFIEDLLLLENRNRKYEPDIYTQRAVYRTQDIDFDLSQFGLFLQNDTLFITFHYNDMIDFIGRKLMNGDVLEIPNLKDYHPLDESIPFPIPKFYVINDASFASEGFSQTWYPHLWRVKAVPLVGGQEYTDLLNGYANNHGGIDGDNGNGNGSGTLSEYMCQHQKQLDINDAILTQAEVEVPLSGYDISSFYIVDYNEEGEPVNYPGLSIDAGAISVDASFPTADSALPTADTTYLPTAFSIPFTVDNASITVDSSLLVDATDLITSFDASTTTFDGTTIGVTVDADTITVDLASVSTSTITGGDPSGNIRLGYLVGDGLAPNGWPVIPGTAFPVNPETGQHVLRLDYKPNRLFRYNGSNWIWVEDNVRTDIYLNGETQRSLFVNNTDTISTTDRGDVPSRQSLSDLLRPDADN
jgi:hypothetical protein